MLNNNTYNLMMQLIEENKSLWRIKNSYKQDAANCAECLAFWNKLIKDKEEHVEDLQNLIKSHF